MTHLGFLCSGVCGNTDESHLATLDDEKKTCEDDSEGNTLTPTGSMWFEGLKGTSTG